MTAERQRWVERTFTVWLDEGTYGESTDAEEIAYLLRMGGIDAEVRSDDTANTAPTTHVEDMPEFEALVEAVRGFYEGTGGSIDHRAWSLVRAWEDHRK